MKSLSRVRLSATPWTAAYQAPPSMGFSRQEYWSGVPLPSPSPTQSKAKSFSDPVVSSQGYSELLRDFLGFLAKSNSAEAKTIGTTAMKTNLPNEENKTLNCHNNRTAEKSGDWSQDNQRLERSTEDQKKKILEYSNLK